LPRLISPELAGKGKGMKDNSTRSGMLWEVERILTECKELGTLPQCLIMENVVQVHGEGNVESFNKWQLRLEELGYKNYWQDLIATDYGIPQTRNRCFMISILGDYSYTFPPKQELKLRLKDMLENEVDEKYYFINEFKPPLENKIENKGNYIQWYKKGWLEHSCRAWKDEKVVETLTCRGGTKVLLGKQLLETIKKIEKEEISSLDLYNRAVINNGLSQTIDTGYHNSQRLYDLKGIRKLTPKECFRLMGVKDEDYEKVAKNQSNASLYHLAGDSIVVNVIEEIIKQLI
jgi:DNA (cytosine-5)-methyltransferase 1